MRLARGRIGLTRGLTALALIALPLGPARAVQNPNIVQDSVLDSRPGRCSLKQAASLTGAVDGLETLRAIQPPAPIVDGPGDDDHKPKPPTGNGNTPRSLDVPRRLLELRRDLRIGQLWIAQNAERPAAVRVSLEASERIIGAITLDPDNGKPVTYQERANYRPSDAPSSPQLSTMLQNLRAQTPDIKFGTFVLPSPRGLEIQVYLTGKLVSYVYLNPSNGEAITDDGAVREIGSSSIRLR